MDSEITLDCPRGYDDPINRKHRLQEICRALLLEIGEDPEREGLRETPRRFADWWTEFVDYDPGKIGTVFKLEQQGSQMVVVSGLRVWSLCEHHLLPFYCDVSIGYIPNGYVLGLSKFGRIVQDVAHRLQIQERMVKEVADSIVEYAGSPDVAVVATGEHLCMTMRGIKMGSKLTSSVMRGAFLVNNDTRSEFLRLASVGST